MGIGPVSGKIYTHRKEYDNCKLIVQKISAIGIQKQGSMNEGPGCEHFLEDVGFHLGPEGREG